jgi:hypothetical protein
MDPRLAVTLDDLVELIQPHENGSVQRLRPASPNVSLCLNNMVDLPFPESGDLVAGRPGLPRLTPILNSADRPAARLPETLLLRVI